MTIKSVLITAFVVVAGLSTTAAAVYAQTASLDRVIPTIFTGDSARDAELRAWIIEFGRWQQWFSQWANRNEPGWVTSSRPRRDKPAPPSWLADRCAEVIAADDVMAKPCVLLEEWRDDNITAALRAQRQSGLTTGEATPHTMWWEHVHVDMLWPATEIHHSVYGVVGLHTATTVKGRMQIFLAPGVMLMNVPALDGSRIWKVAANYGIGWRLLDFRFPGGRLASMHVNIAKSWLMADIEDVMSSRTTDFAGLSISFKRH